VFLFFRLLFLHHLDIDKLNLLKKDNIGSHIGDLYVSKLQIDSDIDVEDGVCAVDEVVDFPVDVSFFGKRAVFEPVFCAFVEPLEYDFLEYAAEGGV